MFFTPLQSNDNKKSHNSRFCSAHNNLVFVMVSMLFVGRHSARALDEPVCGMSHPNVKP
jgi:hypothetical protein